MIEEVEEMADLGDVNEREEEVSARKNEEE
jgi:hypothetical protein